MGKDRAGEPPKPGLPAETILARGATSDRITGKLGYMLNDMRSCPTQPRLDRLRYQTLAHATPESENVCRYSDSSPAPDTTAVTSGGEPPITRPNHPRISRNNENIAGTRNSVNTVETNNPPTTTEPIPR